MEVKKVKKLWIVESQVILLVLGLLVLRITDTTAAEYWEVEIDISESLLSFYCFGYKQLMIKITSKWNSSDILGHTQGQLGSRPNSHEQLHNIPGNW